MRNQEEGITGFDLAAKLHLTDPDRAVLIKINGEEKDFTTPLREGDEVEFVDFDDPRGKYTFWHTSAHILAQAILRLYSNAKPTIGPPIETGFYYDFADLSISENDFPVIEAEMEKVIKENYQPSRVVYKDKREAKNAFVNNPFKLELIDSLEDAGEISSYAQGEFVDLCRGPHIGNLGKVKAIKLMKTSAAYWRGDNTREMLTRIYGVSFPDRKMLKEYLNFLEEAKKRDHRILGNKLDLFTFFDAAPGMPVIKPHGMIIWNRLLDFWRELHRKAGYIEIKTPTMLDKSLWVTSGHWENYRENMYTLELEKAEYAIKPMNCPACMLLFKSTTHSYRDLPLRIGEIGHVHRHELSGSLNGLLRVRAFHQDDAHIFMKPSDIREEILGVLRLAETVYNTFGLDYHLELSTRPAKSVGTDADWEMTTRGLQSALDEWGKEYRINPGDGAFYGPKIDLHVKDALGRTWQCGTIQLDMSLPERFDLEYTGDDSKPHRPIMIHRVIFGSIERFFAILVEHFSGRFPLWLSPRPVRLIPVADRHIDYARSLKEKFLAVIDPVEIDESHESVSKKIRNAQNDQVNYMLTVGDDELSSGHLSVRTRNNVQMRDLKPEIFLENLHQEIISKALHA